MATREENSEGFEINNQMGMEQSEDRNVAVSYTHLDVYKRQV